MEHKNMFKRLLSFVIIFTMLFSSFAVLVAADEATNVALGKSYTVSQMFRQGGKDVGWGWDENAAITYPDEDGITMTDGVIAATDAGFSDAVWAGWNHNAPEYKEIGYSWITVDLGEVTEITGAAIYLGSSGLGSGIGAGNMTVQVAISNDGKEFAVIGSAVPTDDASSSSIKTEIAFESLSVEKAQYVQFRLVRGGWMFVSEVEVYGSAAGNDDPTPDNPTPDDPDEPDDPVVTTDPFAGSLRIELSNNDTIAGGLTNEQAADLLTDGDWALNAEAWGGNTNGVVLFMNKNATQLGAYGKIDLIWEFDETPEEYNHIKLGLYSSVESMIGYPSEEDIFFSNDGITWEGGYYNDSIGYGETIPNAYATFEDNATVPGTVIADLMIRNPQNYKFVKIELYFPKSPFTEANGYGGEGNPAKPRWEFFGVTEFEISYVEPSTFITDFNPAIYWESRGGQNGSYAYTDAAAYEAACDEFLSWWKHVAFAPVEGQENVYEVVGIRNYGDNIAFLDFPEGGFIWTAYFEAADGREGKAALDLFATMNVGDTYELTGFDIENEFVAKDYAIEKWTAPVEPEVPELPEGATALDYAGYVHDNFFEILAGDNMTVADLTNLGIGAAKDMNYFYVVVVDAKNVITETYFTLGRPDGVKSDVVCPEGGYIIGLNANKEGADVLLAAKVGDSIELYNIDVESFRGLEGSIALEKAGFAIIPATEEPDVPDDPTPDDPTPDDPTPEETNVALGKTYTAPAPLDGYNASLTDGAKADVIKYSGDVWYGFKSHPTNFSGNLNGERTGSVVIDLEGNYDLTKVSVHTVVNVGAGVTACTVANVYLSDDGETWGDAIALPVAPESEVADGIYVIEGAVTGSARFVKVELTMGSKTFLFFDEIEVYGVEAEVEPDDPVVPEYNKVTVNVNDNAILTDGKTGFDGNWGAVGGGDVLLITNGECKTQAMQVELLYALGETKKIDSLALDFYHCAGVMIGYPEGTVLVEVSEDGKDYKVIGEYDLAAAELSVGAYGTVTTLCEFDAVDAAYVKATFVVGSSTGVLGDTPTDNKIFWEFASLAEVTVTEAEPPVTSKVVTDFNPAAWGESIGGATGAFIYDDANIYASANIDWWIHTMFVPAETEGTYKVVAVRAPQSGNYLTLAEGAFIWTAWSSAGDTPESSGAYALNFMSNLKVGDLVKFTGVDFANHTTSEDATAEKYVDPNAPVNVALNKDYTLSGDPDSTYCANLTDGNAYGAMSYDNKWFVFNGKNTVDGIGTVIIDLEKCYDISKIQVNLVTETGSGTVPPQYVKLYVSEDGETWGEEVGSLAIQSEDGAYWSELNNLTAHGRFVKLEMKIGTPFSMLNEIEVYGKEATDEPDVPVEPKDGKVDYVIEAPDYCVAGEEITVKVIVKNILIEGGIHSVEFVFNYDNEKLVLINDLDEEHENNVNCYTSLPNDWESMIFVANDYDPDNEEGTEVNPLNDGVINVNVFTVRINEAITEDDEIVFEFKFKVKDDAKGDLGFAIPDETAITAVNTEDNIIDYKANGSEANVHTATVVSGKDATCSETGLTDGLVCDCGEVLVEQEVIPVLSHKTVSHEGKEPTCTEKGWDAYETCSECDYTTYKEKAALGHDDGEWVVTKEATYTEAGSKELRCTVCDAVIKTEEIPMLVKTYTLGDINDDGEIGARDYVLVRRSILGTYELNDVQKLAADINGDGKIDSRDYVFIRRHILGTYVIKG